MHHAWEERGLRRLDLGVGKFCFFLSVKHSPTVLVFPPVFVVNLRGMAGTSVSSSVRSDSLGPPGSSVYGSLPARILELIAVHRGPSQSRDRTCRQVLYHLSHRRGDCPEKQ